MEEDGWMDGIDRIKKRHINFNIMDIMDEKTAATIILYRSTRG